MEEKQYKIAFISAVPFYYQAPMYRALNKIPGVDLTVYFCSDETINGKFIEKSYGAKGVFTKENITDGYRHQFLKNYSPWPSFLRHPFGLVNLGVWNEIKTGRYDAVVLQAWNNITWVVALLACLRFKSKILFMTDSNILEESTRPTARRFFKKMFLGKGLFPLATGFLTSGSANEAFYEHYGVVPHQFVRFPFSWGYEEVFRRGTENMRRRQDIRSSLGFSSEDFVILYAGRLAEEKSLPTLLRAYGKVLGVAKRLYLVGDGPSRESLEKQVRQLGLTNVFFVGFQERESVFDWYVAADVLVLPSGRETWGMVVSEAMCFGLPVIVSDRVGSGPDLVREGENGYIFKAGDPDDLAAKITKILIASTKERESLREKSRKIIRKWIADSFKGAENVLRLLN